MIFKNISKKLKNKHSQKKLKSFINRALHNLVSKNEASRKKQSFRLCKKIFSRILKKVKNSKKTKGNNKKNKVSTNTKPTLVASKKKQNKKVPTKTKINSARKPALIPMLTTTILTNFPILNTQTLQAIPQKYKKRHPAIWQYHDNNNFNAIKRSFAF